MEAFLSDPEKLTVIGLLALIVVGLVTEKIVPGGRAARAERQRDRLFDLIIRMSQTTDTSVLLAQQVLSTAETAPILDRPDAGPMEGATDGVI